MAEKSLFGDLEDNWTHYPQIFPLIFPPLRKGANEKSLLERCEDGSVGFPTNRLRFGDKVKR